MSCATQASKEAGECSPLLAALYDCPPAETQSLLEGYQALLSAKGDSDTSVETLY